VLGAAPIFYGTWWIPSMPRLLWAP
jgi:hypothetical protein